MKFDRSWLIGANTINVFVYMNYFNYSMPFKIELVEDPEGRWEWVKAQCNLAIMDRYEPKPPVFQGWKKDGSESIAKFYIAMLNMYVKEDDTRRLNWVIHTNVKFDNRTGDHFTQCESPKTLDRKIQFFQMRL